MKRLTVGSGWRGLVMASLVVFALMPGVGQAQPYPALPGFTATYEAQYMANTLTATLEFREQADGAHLSLQARVSGWLRALGRLEIRRESTLQEGPAGRRPLHSSSLEHLPGRERNTTLRFDWDNNQAQGRINDATFVLDIPEDTQDFLSTVYRIMVRLNHHADRASEYRLHVLERDRLREYLMRPVGMETITTALGPMPTLLVERSDPERDITLQAWFAPTLNYLPMRLDYEAGRDVIQLDLIRLDWHGVGTNPE